MCWRRRHTPWSLSPTLHHQRGFMALQEQGSLPSDLLLAKTGHGSCP